MESVTCEIKYSGAAVGALLAAAAATEGLLLALPLSGGLRAACMAYVFLQAARACDALLSVRGLRLDLERRVECLVGPRWQGGTLREGSFVLPWLTVVRWRPDGARVDRAVLLLPAMASAEALRKIRVLLRFT